MQVARAPSDASTALIDLVATDTAQDFLSARDLTQGNVPELTVNAEIVR
jgi:hypothetical protein